MAVAAAVILDAGSRASFSGDELYYFGRQAAAAHPPIDYDSLSVEYLLAPHNSHLQLGGKLVYEALFAIFGGDYTPFRVFELLAVLVVVALFFELARVRIGDPAALLLAILLCFLGAAWEALIWPFDLHTVCALAAGLGGLLALERGGRRADPVVCLLLVLSTAFVELGIAFVAGVTVSILIGPERWRRIWIVAVPVVLFGAWYVWARRFEITPIGLEAAGDVPGAVFDSLRAVLMSLTGRIPTGDSVPVPVVGLTTFGAVLAVIALLGFALRLRRGSLPPTIWPVLAVLLAYWTFIGLAGRDPDASRYILAGAILVLLVAADALRDRRPGWAGIAALALVVALALPWNIAKLEDGGDYLAQDADLTRGEFAMLELAGRDATPGYVAGLDEVVRDIGGSPYQVIDPASYRDAVERTGSLANPLDEIRSEDIALRKVHDIVLARTLDLDLEPADAADAEGLRCDSTTVAPGVIETPPGGVLVEPLEGAVELQLSRFLPGLPAYPLATVGEGAWVRLALPGDDGAPEAWSLYFDGPIRACALDPDG